MHIPYITRFAWVFDALDNFSFNLWSETKAFRALIKPLDLNWFRFIGVERCLVTTGPWSHFSWSITIAEDATSELTWRDKWIDSSSLCLLRQRNQSLLSEYTIMLDLTGCVKDRNFWDLSDHSALPLCQINLTKSTAKNLILSTLLQISLILPNCLFVGSLCTKILQG